MPEDRTNMPSGLPGTDADLLTVPFSMEFLAHAAQRKLVLLQLASVVSAASWLYYDSFPDAAELDAKTFGHLTDVFLSLGLSRDELEAVLQQAEVMLNAGAVFTRDDPTNSEGQTPRTRTADAEPEHNPVGTSPATSPPTSLPSAGANNGTDID